ncbi:MAG: hemagglutinin repeat-containing protein [Deferribacteraceae bacterium]|nr:hemagglutinin repeat-containing protein [Deferribacteraceae bacterium]
MKHIIKHCVPSSLKNQDSSVNAGGSFLLKTEEDATFRGAEVNVGGNALFDVGGNMNVLATKDYEYTYYDKQESWGGLKSEQYAKIDNVEELAGSNVTINEGLTIVTGNNTNLVGSNLAVGGDADIYTGYKLNEDGSLEETGTGGSLNVLADYVSETHFEERKETNMLSDFDIDISISTDGIEASMDVGTKTRDMTEHTKTTAVGSTLTTGGSSTLNSNKIQIMSTSIAQ